MSKGILDAHISLYLVKEKEDWQGVTALRTRDSAISHNMSCYADLFAFESSVMIEDLMTISGKVSEWGGFHRKYHIRNGNRGGVGRIVQRGEGVDMSVSFTHLEKSGNSITVARAETVELVHAILSRIGINCRFQKVRLRREIPEEIKRRGSWLLNERKTDSAS